MLFWPMSFFHNLVSSFSYVVLANVNYVQNLYSNFNSVILTNVSFSRICFLASFLLFWPKSALYIFWISSIILFLGGWLNDGCRSLTGSPTLEKLDEGVNDKKKTFFVASFNRRRDIQHNDIQHKRLICDA
jgi:hypothetical protein